MINNGQLIHELNLRIYFSDTDAGGVVYFGNLSKYLEMGFSEWFRVFVAPLKTLNQKYNIFLVIKESSQKFKKPIYYDDEICIRTQLNNIKYYSISFKTDILVQDQVCCSGEITLAALSIKTKLPVKLPPEVLELMKEV